MTKHLRLIMLSLLAMICMGGYSQSGVIIWQEDWTGAEQYEAVNKNHDNYSVGNKDSKIYSNNYATGDIPELLLRAKDNFTVSIKDLKGCSGELTLTFKTNNSNLSTIKANGKTVSFSKKGNDREATLNIEEGVTSLKLVFTCGTKSNTRLDNFMLVGKKATSLSFEGKNSVTLVEGKLNGEEFKGYTAKETTGIAGRISYNSNNEVVTTVDKYGQLTFKGYGTAKITATFTPTDEGTYAKSSASYTVINEEGVRTPTTITFGSGVDNNTFEVKDGDTFEGKAATVTPVDATGSIEYKSSDEAIAKVDAATGAITLGAKYGTAVITAKFVATGSFANSEASYSIKHVGDFVFYESFDKCDGTGGNDGQYSGNIAFNVWNAGKLDEVWAKSGKVYLGNKCIRIGKDLSSVTTSSIEYTGKSILTFKAAAWSTDDTKVQLTITGGTLKYGENEPTTSVSFNPTKGEWQTFEMEVTSTGPFTLQFANETTSRRFFLDEVMIKKVNAVSPKEITLDENGDNIVEKAENVNVTLKRTLYGDGGWNTLCVPFTLTEAQTKAAFGNNVELRELESVAGNTLTFKTVNSVTANVPCLIKVTAAGNEYKFEGVSTTAVKNNRDYTLSLVEGNILFLGIYSAMDVVEADLVGSSTNGYYAFLGANNTFFKAKAGTTMKAFRAFFSVPNDVNTKQLKAVIDGTTTGLEDLVIDGVKANGRVYNLNGQYVGNSLNGLQPGLYIQNGKKIVIK